MKRAIDQAQAPLPDELIFSFSQDVDARRPQPGLHEQVAPYRQAGKKIKNNGHKMKMSFSGWLEAIACSAPVPHCPGMEAGKAVKYWIASP